MSGEHPNLDELDRVVKEAESFTLKVRLKRPTGEPVNGSFQLKKSAWRSEYDEPSSAKVEGMLIHFFGPDDLNHVYSRPSGALRSMSDDFNHLQKKEPEPKKFFDILDLGRVEVRATEDWRHDKPPTPAKLKKLIIKAIHEACGEKVPTDAELRGASKAKTAKKKSGKAEILDELRGGIEGIRAFNKRDRKDVTSRGPYQRLKFKDCDMSGVNLNGLDFRGCTFENCTLKKARLTNANLRGAKFHGADLSGAIADNARIEGADFTGATLDGASLKLAWCNKKTVFPGEPPRGLYWTDR